jgi:hypothetical protein
MTLLYGRDANGNQVPLLVDGNGIVQTSGGSTSWPGTSSQLTAGDGTAVNVGTGLTLSSGTLRNGGSLPSVGDYTWIPSGAGPYANQGTAGAAQATAGSTSPGTTPSSQGLWPSGRTGLRGYAINSSSEGVLTAANTFSAAWQNSSITIEAYLQLDFSWIVVVGRTFPLILNDFGIGANAINITSTSTGGSNIGFSLEVQRAGSTVGTIGIPAGLITSRPVHLAIVLDRTNSSAVTLTLYVDGFVVSSAAGGTSSISLGSFAAFTNPFTQLALLLGGAGIVGWVSLTNSAKTASQIRDNTLLLKAA